MFIQIAGVHDMPELTPLLSLDITHVALPLGPGVREQDLSLEKAGEVFANLPRSIAGVLITYLRDAADISAFCFHLGCGWVQLHGEISSAEARRLSVMRPDLKIIKSLVVGKKKKEDLFKEYNEFSAHCHMFITDTYDPGTGACGATGRVHDWEVSRSIVRESPRPVILAGGLDVDNVYEAVMHVAPVGVDAHSGLEDSRGIKDPEKVREFVREALRAEQDLTRMENR
jgi:phosphoribosylanthranilate isomerase